MPVGRFLIRPHRTISGAAFFFISIGWHDARRWRSPREPPGWFQVIT
jgi:hypothetical protein